MYDIAERRAHFLTKYGTLTNMVVYCVAFTLFTMLSIVRYFDHGVFDVTQWFSIKYVLLTFTSRLKNDSFPNEYFFFQELHTIRQR